jgi:hypothetical protein
MVDNWSPNYREWAPGEWEQTLSESREDFDPAHRLKRVERLSLHIKCGAERSLCRQFVYTEEEWRSGCRMAGGEPGHGWITQSGPKSKAEPKPAPAVPVQSELVTIGALLGDYDDIPF